MTSRVYNFASGPSTIPLEVLLQAQKEFLNWHDIGYGVLEMGHRSPEFTHILTEAITRCRLLLQIPAEYHIIFLQSGAIGQNAIIPLNISGGKKVDFIVSGHWSENSYHEAQKYCLPEIVAHSKPQLYTCWPHIDTEKLNPEAQYIHICDNETLLGVENNHGLVGSVPMVLDMTSNIFTKPIASWSNVGIIFASAQKNLGMAGVTLVIIKDQLLRQSLPICPSAFNYTKIVEYNSCFNTPPTFAIYVSGLVMQWSLQQIEGELTGVPALYQRSKTKSQLLYNFIDESKMYQCKVTDPQSRSRLNITFDLIDPTLNDKFMDEAKNAALVNLNGHSKIGGMRASLYNAMPVEGVERLVEFMEYFQRKYLR